MLFPVETWLEWSGHFLLNPDLNCQVTNCWTLTEMPMSFSAKAKTCLIWSCYCGWNLTEMIMSFPAGTCRKWSYFFLFETLLKLSLYFLLWHDWNGYVICCWILTDMVISHSVETWLKWRSYDNIIMWLPAEIWLKWSCVFLLKRMKRSCNFLSKYDCEMVTFYLL